MDLNPFGALAAGQAARPPSAPALSPRPVPFGGPRTAEPGADPIVALSVAPGSGQLSHGQPVAAGPGAARQALLPSPGSGCSRPSPDGRRGPGRAGGRWFSPGPRRISRGTALGALSGVVFGKVA
ncbi:hypothetical protein AB0A63_22890 [Lentzea sp. NPDC042327]|uniref:hypothetical protein n=1 Tax=Lentzea sp. NPDC042327 TaxID=3154801 RepID=UPI0033C23F2E